MTERLKKKKKVNGRVCSVVVEGTTSVQNGCFNAEYDWSKVFGDGPVVGSLQSWKSSVLLFHPSESRGCQSTPLLNMKEDI